MDDWEKLNETSLPERENCYSHHLSIKDVTDADFSHAKWACKDFEINNSVEYQDVYLQSDTLLLAGVFSNF